MANHSSSTLINTFYNVYEKRGKLTCTTHSKLAKLALRLIKLIKLMHKARKEGKSINRNYSYKNKESEDVIHGPLAQFTVQLILYSDYKVILKTKFGSICMETLFQC